MAKRPLGIDVLTAARKRIEWTFDTFRKVCVSFSGGKDSTVMLHLVAEEARKRNKRFAMFFIDWECQYKLTVDFVQSMFDAYDDIADPYWICLPFRTVNAVSQFEPEWICWEDGKDWVREIPPLGITDRTFFPFYTYGMTFEEFVPEFGRWYGGDDLTAIMVGIRSDESLNRFRTIAAGSNGGKATLDGKPYTTWQGKGTYNVYPIYDWRTEDDWRYVGKFFKPYNHLYDLMHKAGIPIHNQRICEPFGNEQRRGLHLFAIIEPETWGKLVARVNGANFGATYTGEKGNVLGNIKVNKPDGKSWKQFAELLLSSMPESTAEHYRNKIAIYLHWYMGRGFSVGIPDEQDGDCGEKDDKPSWRRICKIMLRNDYWCKGLSFSVTKASHYKQYLKVMQHRRASWGIYV